MRDETGGRGGRKPGKRERGGKGEKRTGQAWGKKGQRMVERTEDRG